MIAISACVLVLGHLFNPIWHTTEVRLKYNIRRVLKHNKFLCFASDIKFILKINSLDDYRETTLYDLDNLVKWVKTN